MLLQEFFQEDIREEEDARMKKKNQKKLAKKKQVKINKLVIFILNIIALALLIFYLFQ
jgi:cytoskeletal protein RodZ